MLPSGALALEPGVHVDPGSPAGKQYQIPIATARSEAAGGSGASNSTAPAFGVGVTPSGGSGPGSGGTGGVAASGQHRAADQRGHGADAGSGSGSPSPGRPPRVGAQRRAFRPRWRRATRAAEAAVMPGRCSPRAACSSSYSGAAAGSRCGVSGSERPRSRAVDIERVGDCKQAGPLGALCTTVVQNPPSAPRGSGLDPLHPCYL